MPGNPFWLVAESEDSRLADRYLVQVPESEGREEPSTSRPHPVVPTGRSSEAGLSRRIVGDPKRC